MPPSSDSRGAAIPTSFESCGYRYIVHRPLVLHPDYDPLLLASRQSMRGGPVKLVELKHVVLKHSGHKELETLLEEVRLARYLRHSNIAAIHGFAVHDQRPYIVMEHLRGCFLLTLMDAAMALGRKLSPGFAAYVAAEVADALAHAHHCVGEDGRPLHIVHRAVGPMRIRLGKSGRVQLTNFGAAWSELLDRILSPIWLLRGDPTYIAPEILRQYLPSNRPLGNTRTSRKFDARADIFSLGMVLLEMLVGFYPLEPPDQPFRDNESRFPSDVRSELPTPIALATLATRILRLGSEEVERLSQDAPPELRRIVSRALRPEPAERYPSAHMMAADLRVYLAGLGRYGPKEVVEESTGLLRAASELAGSLDAHSGVERGVLPQPPDLEARHSP
jgi:eukaryotic-like serine/threonine-protein kinase